MKSESVPQLESHTNIEEMTFEDWQEIYLKAGMKRSMADGIPDLPEGSVRDELRELLTNLDNEEAPEKRSDISRKIVGIVNRNQRQFGL